MQEITKKKSSLLIVTHVIGFFIISLFLFSNLIAANAQGKAKSEGKSTAKYQGTISGEWSGKVQNGNIAVDGTFSITIFANGIVSGTFTGLQSGTITGTVSTAGEINAQGSAGISDWSGQVSVEDGRLSGSGTWEGYGGGGTWKSK